MASLAAYSGLDNAATSLSAQNITRAEGGSTDVIVTVDNGSAGALNQHYLNSQVTSATATTNGGTFNRTWSGAQAFGTNGGELMSYISTDSAGVPTLDLSAQPTTSAYTFHDNVNGDGMHWALLLPAEALILSR
jgi:hypothetical protein